MAGISAELFLFLTFQALSAVFCAEVAVRFMYWYFNLYRTNQDSWMVTMLLGISTTHGFLAIDNGWWMLNRIINPDFISNITDSIDDRYWQLAIWKFFVWFASLFHIIPLWQILHAYSWGHIWACIVLRIFITLTAYWGLLTLNGTLIW